MRLKEPIEPPKPGDVVHWPNDPGIEDVVLACYAGESDLNLWMVRTPRSGWTIVRWTSVGWMVDPDLSKPVQQAI